MAGLAVAAALLWAGAGCTGRREDPRAGKAVASETAPRYVGLRRGWTVRPTDDTWWIQRARDFAASVGGGARPAIVQIVSTYDRGGTQFGFPQPASYLGPTKDMVFGRGRVDHAAALAAYEAAGVKAILQIEPGRADVGACLAVVRAALGRSACVIGYGVDAEWIDAAAHKDGRPVTDAQARGWMEAVAAGSASATLFLKHWDASHMPPSYRHERLWFLDDSQRFAGSGAMLAEFAAWGRRFVADRVGFQYGYPADRGWWGRLKRPPTELTEAIGREVGNARYFFWVDFSVEEVTFR